MTPTTTKQALREGRRQAELTRERYAERFPGWRRSEARVCPRVVAGKRCRAYSGWSNRRCICERHPRVLDHHRIWRTPDRETVFTSEPYGLDGEAFAAFVDDCADLGLRVRVDGRSPWYPESTVLVIVRRAKEAQ